jgi:hypothetical protein
VELPSTGDITVVHDARVADMIRRCYSDIEVNDREGSRGRGGYQPQAHLRLAHRSPRRSRRPSFYGGWRGTGGWPSADRGSSPLTALVAFRLGLPAVFVRSLPKQHLFSYGGDDATNHPRLAGDRLPIGTTIHVIDDFVHSAATLTSAVESLRDVGLVVNSASSLLASPPEALADAVRALQIRLTPSPSPANYLAKL